MLPMSIKIQYNSNLLFQIQPELITLNPMDIVHVNRPSKKNTTKDDDDEVSFPISSVQQFRYMYL